MTTSDPTPEDLPARHAEPGSEPRWLTAEGRAAWLAATALMGLLPAALDARM